MKTAVMLDSEQLTRLLAFATAPENLYEPTTADFTPGDRPGYIAEVPVTIMGSHVGVLEQRLRVVFSITKIDGTRYRHLSVSLLSGDTTGIDVPLGEGFKLKSTGLPGPSAVEAVGLTLGFKGRLTTWEVDVLDERVIVAMQRMEDA